MFGQLKRLVFLCASFWLLIALNAIVFAGDEWHTLKNCQFLPRKANDGDSFYVKHGDKKYIFRLYFVDAAETDNGLITRIEEQAAYFGISVDAAMRYGNIASRFVAQRLAAGNFTVITRWENALGRSKQPRYFAFVLVEGKDLSELLVEHGLARVYGAEALMPDGTAAVEVKRKLMKLEAVAKAQRLGAWAGEKGARNSAVEQKEFYQVSIRGIRHNSKCRHFNSDGAKPCGPREGTPCKVCGG